ncbi:MAG: HAD family hydrolase [Lachnospiraceae bacterium]|nr:HAD family hydrolase [Lachnospiraceae bacterium]
MIKLVVSDIDGTLVPDGSDQINPEIFAVIRQLRQKGVVFAAASGRQFISIKKLFAPIAEEIYYITDGGSVVRNCDDIYSSKVITQETVKEMAADIIAIPGCEVMLCGKKCVYVLDQTSEMSRWLRNSYHFDVKEIPGLDTQIDDEIVKVSLYHVNDAENKAKPFFTPKWGKEYQLSCAGKMWIDCSDKSANKGTALRVLQKKLNVLPRETMAFGDNINDMEMLALAEYSVAIGNARAEVKNVVKYIADTNENDGVLKELKKLLYSIS